VIRKPTDQPNPEKIEVGIRRLLIVLILLPVFVFAGAFVGTRLSPTLSRLHPTVRLAERIVMEDMGELPDTTLESDTFRTGERTTGELVEEARLIQQRIRIGGIIMGGFIGLVFGTTLVLLSIRRRREEYQPDRAACFSCGRCVEHCVMERTRRSESTMRVRA
jgi:hypothetical protein